MKILVTLKKLPDEKKKMFAGITALILTILIIIFWVAFGPKKKDNGPDLKAIIPDEEINSLKQSVQKSIDDFNTMKDQIYGTTTSTSTISTTTNY